MTVFDKAAILVRKHDEWHESHIGLFEDFVDILKRFEGAKNTEQQVQLDSQNNSGSLFETLAEATRPAARKLT